MGRASGCNAGGEKAIARELVLKVAMHCRCDGCTPKVRSAVRNLALAPGVLEVLGRSATEATEEVRLLATADPERLRRRLHKATGKKKVDLVLTPPNKPIKKSSDRGSGHKEGPRLVAAAAVQAPLADPQLEVLLAHLQRQAPLRGHRDQYVDDGAAAALPGNYHHQQQQQQPNLDWGSYGEAYPWPWVPPHWPAPAVDWGANYGPARAPPGNCDPSAPPWHSGLGF